MVIGNIVSKKNRILLRELVATDFKLRYQGSMLGYAWSLLRPLMLFLILYVVFVKFLKLGTGIPHYPVYLLLGTVIWNFFGEITSQGVGAIVGRGELIRKIRIPLWIIVLSSSISALINLGLNLLVVLIFMAANHVDPMRSALLFPLVLVELYLFALGISLFLSAAFVKFRDLSYIWEVVLQGGFYITPILYPLSRITNLKLQKLIFMNPMAQIIQDARYAVVTHQTTTVYQVLRGRIYLYIPFALVLLVLLGGLRYFKQQSKQFAENV